MKSAGPQNEGKGGQDAIQVIYRTWTRGIRERGEEGVSGTTGGGVRGGDEWGVGTKGGWGKEAHRGSSLGRCTCRRRPTPPFLRE